MNYRAIVAGSIFLLFLLNSCGGLPPTRMESYLGIAPKGTVEKPAEEPATLDRKLEVALLVLNDTTAEDSAPPMSKELLDSLTARVGGLVQKELPITVVKVIETNGVEPNSDAKQFVQLANSHGVEFVVLAIFSSAEVEYPTFHAFGPTQPSEGGGSPGRASQLGFRAENYALVEMAVLAPNKDHVLVQADGRDWASLDRLNVPVESNNFPVIRRSRRVSPIFPTEENAHDALRGVSGSEALDQALMHLKEAWNEKFAAAG